MDRRELLKMIVAATGAAMVGLPALVHGKVPAAGAMPAFSDADIGMLDEIAETILPRTRTPGAKDAGAGAFMATFVSDCYTARQQATFRAGWPTSTRAPVAVSYRSRRKPAPGCCERWTPKPRHAMPT